MSPSDSCQAILKNSGSCDPIKYLTVLAHQFSLRLLLSLTLLIEFPFSNDVAELGLTSPCVHGHVQSRLYSKIDGNSSSIAKNIKEPSQNSYASTTKTVKLSIYWAKMVHPIRLRTIQGLIQ
jgi:hypothetical protein